MNYRKPYEVTKRTVYEYQVDEFNYIHPKKNQSENDNELQLLISSSICNCSFLYRGVSYNVECCQSVVCEWRHVNEKKYYITISLIVAIAILIIDQVTKRIIATTMNIGDSYEVIPNF